MASFLHLVKRDSPSLAAPTIEANRRQPGARVTVVIVDGSVPDALPSGISVRRLGDGHLDYPGLLDLIFEHDHVITW